MQRGVYLKNAAIMTMTGLVLRAVGMLFRVYIAGKIGAQGMGVYQLITTAYTMAVTLGTAGLTLAATRICADLLAEGCEGEVKHALHKVILLGAATGCLTAAALFFSADWIAVRWLTEPRAALSLKILAPSLPFMAFSSSLRGYFMARRNVVPPSRAQLAEQAVRIALVAGLFYAFDPQEVVLSCAIVVMGNTVSEAVSWLILALGYEKDIRSLPKRTAKNKVRRSSLCMMWLPIAGNHCLAAALHTVENVMVPACLAVFLASRETALEQYGALKGMAMPVLFFPFSLLGTLSALLMPEIASAHVQGKKSLLCRLVQRVMLITLVLSIFAALEFTVFSAPIGQVLYKSEEIGFYLHVLGPLMPFLYLESMVDGMLKGVDEQLATFRYTVFDSVLRIAGIAFLVPRWGVKGFLLVMMLSNLFTCSMNLNRLLRVTECGFLWIRWLVKPLFCALTAALIHYFVITPCTQQWGTWIRLLVEGGAVAVIYFVAIDWTGCLSWREFLENLPIKCRKSVDK